MKGMRSSVGTPQAARDNRSSPRRSSRRCTAKTPLTTDSLSRDFAVETVFRESLIDTIQQLTRGLVKSSQFREYADRRKGKSGER